jgi:16S rRNA (uracil1498-N3)-methyltransferase
VSRVPRLFCAARLAPGEQVTLDETAAGHALRVLRLRIGDAVILFNGDGHDYAGRLVSGGRHGAAVEIHTAGPVEASAVLSLHLVLGVSRGQRMDFALQKATELGVTAVTPVFTARSMVRLGGEKLARRAAHWRRVVISACEQCGRRRLPTLDPPGDCTAWLDGWDGTGILLDPASRVGLAQLAAPTGGTTLLVGPEGGLTRDERARAAARGFQGVRLGPRILRTETAPLAAIAAIQALWGDFR